MPDRARTPTADPVVLVHESLKQDVERIAIVWGQSDNAQPKRKMREMARQYRDLAFATLIDLCTRKDAPAQQLGAAKELLERGYGKSVEHVEIDDKRDPATVDMVRDAVREMAKDPEQRAMLRAAARGPN